MPIALFCRSACRELRTFSFLCTTNIGSIKLQLTNLDSTVASAAIDAWANGCNGFVGSAFPSVGLGFGDITFYVDYEPGRSYGSNPNGCAVTSVVTGSTSSGIVGGQIIIWEQDSYGNPCGDPQARLEHEMGHMFGLLDTYDSACANAVMYGYTSSTSVSFADACTAIDPLWDTPQEIARDSACVSECRGTCYQGRCDSSECFQYPDGSYSSNCYSPILIGIGGHGYHITSAAQGVQFDLNSDGQPESLSWPRDGDNAFLCLDRNHDGKIDKGRELFGNYTLLSDGSMAHNGFAALAEYDHAELGGNQNGWIDRGDAIWPSLLLWEDANHDGISQPSELVTLDAAGVVRIDVRYRLSKRVDEFGNAFRYKGNCVVLRNGKEHDRNIYDVFFVLLQAGVHNIPIGTSTQSVPPSTGGLSSSAFTPPTLKARRFLKLWAGRSASTQSTDN
jgi:hypothetical protein